MNDFFQKHHYSDINRTNTTIPISLPIIANEKWWKEIEVDETFRKANNYGINAGASCRHPALSSDKNEEKNKKGKTTKSKAKINVSKGSKKDRRKISKK